MRRSWWSDSRGFFLLILFFAGYSVAMGIAVALPTLSHDLYVVRVVDGDTVRTNAGTVRLLGVNTPETVHPFQPVGCYGPEASRFTKLLLPVGEQVVLVEGPEAIRVQNLMLWNRLSIHFVKSQ